MIDLIQLHDVITDSIFTVHIVYFTICFYHGKTTDVQCICKVEAALLLVSALAGFPFTVFQIIDFGSSDNLRYGCPQCGKRFKVREKWHLTMGFFYIYKVFWSFLHDFNLLNPNPLSARRKSLSNFV